MLEEARPKQRMVIIGEKSACLLALNPFMTEVLPSAPVACQRHPRVEMAFVGDAVAKDVLEGIDQGVTEGVVLATGTS
jgi:ribonucleotide monophosphatase NagD (HAD superfamily)